MWSQIVLLCTFSNQILIHKKVCFWNNSYMQAYNIMRFSYQPHMPKFRIMLALDVIDGSLALAWFLHNWYGLLNIRNNSIDQTVVEVCASPFPSFYLNCNSACPCTTANELRDSSRNVHCSVKTRCVCFPMSPILKYSLASSTLSVVYKLHNWKVHKISTYSYFVDRGSIPYSLMDTNMRGEGRRSIQIGLMVAIESIWR